MTAPIFMVSILAILIAVGLTAVLYILNRIEKTQQEILDDIRERRARETAKKAEDLIRKMPDRRRM